MLKGCVGPGHTNLIQTLSGTWEGSCDDWCPKTATSFCFVELIHSKRKLRSGLIFMQYGGSAGPRCEIELVKYLFSSKDSVDPQLL